MRVKEIFALAAGLPMISTAQWTVTRLGPAGSTQESFAHCANGAKQGGSVGTRASIWSRSSSTRIELAPASSSASAILGMSGSHQVGYANFGDKNAYLWSGSAGSAVSLHPAGSNYSSANSVANGQQAGFVATVAWANEHAAIWSGTAASWIDLHPGGPGKSIAYSTDGTYQCGEVNYRACMWSGTAASYVNLHPFGMNQSEARCVSGGQQVGYYFEPNIGPRACIWSGTAESVVNINPAGAIWSDAFACSGGQQVGVAGYTANPQHRATLWSGSAASAVDLSLSLPDFYAESRATGISHDSGATYITGYARNMISGHNDAILWRSPTVPTAISGVVAINDVVWNPGYARSITVRVKQGTITLAIRTIAVGTVAAVSLNAPGAGNAEVTIDGPTQLLRRRAVFLDGNPIDLGVVVLNNGDPDGSGEVDAADVDIVIAQFGQMDGSLADVDLSGEVDAADIDIIIANFGAVDE